MLFLQRCLTKFKDNRGLTMIELLVVLVILGILLLAAIMNTPKFIARANDGRRKSDLEAFRIAFERYFEDTGCYPDPSLVSTCRAETMKPYLPFIMCDPRSNEPYTYVRPDCKTFTLYSTLSDVTDPEIQKIGCQNGCGPDVNSDGQGDFNYGVSSGNVNAGTPTGGAVLPNCGPISKPYCFPNLCNSCCPGYGRRCNASGTLCIPDAVCSEL